ncbi:unnamed protein product, partial [Mesorhabditis belari]|uniref:Uncharacterized protein n=1 Tax=Mesorhabditis belari TaxID=2138241 RepID=A0AAF3FL12_9BILA
MHHGLPPFPRPSAQPPPEVNVVKPAPHYDIKFVERDMHTYVRMPALLKWSEKGFGELICAASIYTWNSVSYRVAFDTDTLLDDSLITSEFSSSYIQGQQFFLDLLLQDVHFIGENLGPFVDNTSSVKVQTVKARRLSRKDDNFTFPLLKAQHCQISSYMALRGDRNGTVFEGWNKNIDEFCHVFLPLQKCSRQTDHICPSQLSMLPLTGKRVPMPNWLHRLFKDIRKLKYLLVDFEVYKGWHHAFGTVTGFVDTQQIPTREIMEVTIEDVQFNVNYGVQKIEQSIRHSEEARQKLLGARCLMYLHLNLPGWGLPHYSVRLWQPENEELRKLWKECDGRSSLNEYPLGPIEPPLSQYYYDFISGATKCSLTAGTVANERIYEAIDLDLEGLDLNEPQATKSFSINMDNQSLLATLSLTGFSLHQNDDKGVLHPIIRNKDCLDDVLEQTGHPYPTDKAYRCDRIPPTVKFTYEPKWRVWMDSSVHNDKRLRQIISAAKHQLTREPEALSSGFRLRIDWKSFFLDLRDRPGPLTKKDVHAAVHRIVTERFQLLEEQEHPIVEEETNKVQQAPKSPKKEDFARRQQRILERIRNAPPIPDGFWPTLRGLSNLENLGAEPVREVPKQEPVCEKLIDID